MVIFRPEPSSGQHNADIWHTDNDDQLNLKFLSSSQTKGGSKTSKYGPGGLFSLYIFKSVWCVK